MYEEFTQNRIAQLRMQKNVSARDMSLSLGQNNSYINQIENKKALPSLQGLFYICEYFGCLLYTSPSPRDLSTSVNTLVSRHSNFLMMAAPIPFSLPIWLRI